jgi:hypothetical protein
LLQIAEFDDGTATAVIQCKRLAEVSQADEGKPVDSEVRRTSRNESADAQEKQNVDRRGAARSDKPSASDPRLDPK